MREIDCRILCWLPVLGSFQGKVVGVFVGVGHPNPRLLVMAVSFQVLIMTSTPSLRQLKLCILAILSIVVTHYSDSLVASDLRADL